MRHLLLGLAALLGLAQAPRTQWVEVSPVAESDAAHPGTTALVALDVTVAAGFHAQSNHPRDPSLIPMTLAIDAPPGITPVEVVFPKPTDFSLPGYQEPLSVFEGRIVIAVPLAIAKDHAPGTVTIPAHLRYQACNDRQCFRPVVFDTAWTVRVAAAGEPVRKDRPEIFRGIAFGHGDPPAASAASPANLPPAPAASSGEPANVIRLFDSFDVLRADGGYMKADDFLTFLHDAESGAKRKGLLEGRGPLAVIALVFIGGLALNLTPCVLPMIPINLAIIGAGAQASRRSRGLLLGATYGLAMAVVYGVLGIVVILTAGTFGTINASPWFNVAIAALFIYLGLAMFDVVSLDFSRFSSRIRFGSESRGTFFLAFAMGAVAALLAGACVAPVVIQVVVFASNLYASGTTLALGLPFFLGLGMAIPWPLAGAGLAALPKPGMWMVRVKQVLGLFILGTAVYYGYVAYGIVSSRWVDPASVKASVEEQLKAGWYASPADGLLEARRKNSLVLVDFWATWCKNCLVMDETTLKDPAVARALSGYTKIKFQAEDPDASPAKDILQRVGGKGLPTYAVLRPK